VGVDPPGADGSGVGAAVAGPAPEDSARVDDPGVEVVVAGFSWSFTALAALMKSSPLSYNLEEHNVYCATRRKLTVQTSF
jgi:hypothetical protein